MVGVVVGGFSVVLHFLDLSAFYLLPSLAKPSAGLPAKASA